MGILFSCMKVSESRTGQFTTDIETISTDELPKGEVLIRVHYSSLNYKDALSASGHKGITHVYPHTPGIDAAGVVESSTVKEWKEGDKVIVTGFDLGMNTHGGFSQYISVPAGWIVALPEGMTLRESMIYGTAGFTAALSVASLIHNAITPKRGNILVTGASGGVGSLTVAILSHLGYEVTAASGKSAASDFLIALGATAVIPRSELEDTSGKALLEPRFGSAVDTVGGSVLATVIKTLEYGGTVTTCGMVNGIDLSTSIYPFILRGVQLSGVDSVAYPISLRHQMWQKLAEEWKPAKLQSLVREITLPQLPTEIQAIGRGTVQGRIVVKIE